MVPVNLRASIESDFQLNVNLKKESRSVVRVNPNNIGGGKSLLTQGK